MRKSGKESLDYIAGWFLHASIKGILSIAAKVKVKVLILVSVTIFDNN